MKRIIMMLTVAAMLVVALSVTAPMAFAKNTETCDFDKGKTTCTTVHGSHGSTDTHQGSPDSNGKDRGGGPCKVTGSDHTC